MFFFLVLVIEYLLTRYLIEFLDSKFNSISEYRYLINIYIGIIQCEKVLSTFMIRNLKQN